MLTLLLGLLIALHPGSSTAPLYTADPMVHQAAQAAFGLIDRFPSLPPTQVHAYAGLVLSPTGEILWERNADEQLPIASISKLVTMLVVTDAQPDFEGVVTVINEDNANVEGSRLYVSEGETVGLLDLFYTSLVGSANNSTKAVARSTGLNTDAFAARMNARARQLGMTGARFYEPTGLDPRNTATARDVARLGRVAFQQPLIRAALMTPIHKFVTEDRNIHHTIHNTNQLLDRGIISKTGYLPEAGYTYVAESVDGSLVVLLRQWNTDQRFAEAGALLDWADQYQPSKIFTRY